MGAGDPDLIRLGFIPVVVLQQAVIYAVYALHGWDSAQSLQLHISRVSALLGLVYLLTGSRRVMDVLYCFGLWAWASFSYPQQVQPADNGVGWSFFVNHALTLLMPERSLLPMLEQPWYLLASIVATFTLFWLGYGVSCLVRRRADDRSSTQNLSLAASSSATSSAPS